MKKIEFVIITGLSGAGKSEAARCFEDMGYFCIDNLPPTLISRMAELCALPGSNIQKVALVSDVRGRGFFSDLQTALDYFKQRQINYKILYLEAADEVLLHRFKETRRPHPLAKDGTVLEGVKKERQLLALLKGQADIVIDSSNLSAHELRNKIKSLFLGPKKAKAMTINIVSFGYKYGTPLDADIIMDVRFLPNPHYVSELKNFNGTQNPIKEFVLGKKVTKEFLTKFYQMLKFLLPYYIAEGKSYLTLALGCTGGTHRSVTLAEEVSNLLKAEGYHVVVKHRDLGKDFERI